MIAPLLDTVDAHPFDAPRVGVENLEFEQLRAGDDLAAQRQPSRKRHQIAAERIDILGGVAEVEVVTDDRHHILEFGARIGDVGAVRLAHHVGFGVLIVLVGDFADDLLDDILDRDNAVGAAIFVDHQRQMNLLGLHALQQIDDPRRWRHEQNFTHDLGSRQRHRQIDGLEIEPGRQRFLALFVLFRIDRGMRGHEGDQVADVHHADRIVECVVVDHQTRMGGAFENPHQLADLDVLLYGNDIRAGHHDVADTAFAQAENVLQHPAFFRREAGFARRHIVEHVLEVGADRARLPAEQRAKRAHQPVAAAFGRRQHHRKIARLERRVAGGTGGR